MKRNDEYLNRTPNRDAKMPSQTWIGIVWHGTGGNPANPRGTLNYNLSPKIKSSYHDLIAADGTWFGYLDPDLFNAWHAGVSKWSVNGATYTGGGINARFIGVELDETNKGVSAPRAQLDAAARLALYYRDRYGIPLAEPYHVTHKQVAPGRKIDPTCTTVAAILKRARELDGTTPTPPKNDYEQAWGDEADYHPTWGIAVAWRREIDEGRDPGAMLGPEEYINGVAVQIAQRAAFLHKDGRTHVVPL